MNKFFIVSGVLLLSFFLIVTCTDTSGKEHEHGSEAHFMEWVRQHQSAINYDEMNASELDSGSLLTVHAELPGITDFFTEKRASKLTSFPCSNCHNQSLENMLTNNNPKIKKAHWDIHLVHAEKSVMSCVTCHSGNDMDQLVSLTGQKISIDESFKQCGQCHSTQYKDWQGGAHGKQLNGWKPPRIAKTCVSCHNLHQPAFPKRFPARLNTNQLGD